MLKDVHSHWIVACRYRFLVNHMRSSYDPVRSGEIGSRTKAPNGIGRDDGSGLEEK
jgi:hypothetical protein